MKRAVKWAAGIAAVLAILVVAAVLVVASLDLNNYRDDVSAQAEAALGRKLVIAGDISAKVSLFPTVAVEKVSLANVPGGSRPNMAEVRRVEVRLEVLPLLSGTIRLRHVFIDGLNVVLETDAQGRGNWEFGKPGQPAQTSGGATEIPYVAAVEVKDLIVAFNDARSGQKLQLSLDSLEVEADSPNSPLDLEVKGTYQGVKFEADGTAGSVASLLANQAYPVKLTAKAAGATLKVDGRIAQPMQARGLDMTLAVEGSSLKSTIDGLAPVVPALKDVAVYDPGPYNVAARVSGAMEKLAIADLKLAVGKPDTIQIDATGSIADVLAVKGMKLEFGVKATDTTALAKAAGVIAPAIQGLAVTGRVADGAAGRPSVDVTVNWQSIDLSPTPASPSVAARSQPAPAGGGGQGRVIPTDPLPLDALKSADVKLTLRGQRLVVDGITVEAIEVDSVLARGKLDVSRMQAKVAGGTVGGRLTLDASRPAPDLDANLQIAGLDTGGLLKAMKVTDWLQGGRLDAQTHIKGAGRSPAEIAAGLNGNVEATLGEGKIRSRAFDLLGADLSMEAFRALPFVGGKDEYSHLTCGAVKVGIKDGTATAANGIAIETEKMNVVASGTVDLKTERLDIAVKPEPKGGVGIGLGRLASLMRIRGTLAGPQLGVDQMGMARGALSAGSAVATGGLSLLAEGLLTRVTGDAAPCQTALGKAPPKAPAGQAPAQQTAPAQKQPEQRGVGGFLRGLGQSLEDAVGGKK